MRIKEERKIIYYSKDWKTNFPISKGNTSDKPAGAAEKLPFKPFNGRYIMLETDFCKLVGIDVTKHKAFYNMAYFDAGRDWNVWCWKENNREQKVVYLYPCGVIKAIKLLHQEGLSQIGTCRENMCQFLMQNG